MAIALDGFAALHAIGAHRDVFAPARVEIDRAARMIVTKCLKEKSLDVAGLRAMRSALGDDALALVVFELKPGEILGLLKRLDPYRPDLATLPQADVARHLMALATGDNAPTAPPANARTKGPEARPPRRIESALMTAFAKRRSEDD